MKQNWSNTKSAKANRKWRLAHPVENAMNKLHWLQKPGNFEVQQMMQHAWQKQNAVYVREYRRISNAIAKARKLGDSKLERKLLVERRCHCMTLRNRKTPGPMKPL